MSRKKKLTEGEEIDEQLEEEIKQFLKEKEKIRSIIGNIGGKNTRKSEIVNVTFITLLILSFIGSVILSEPFQSISIDIAILLVSFKISYMLYQAAKVNHFQFWILSSIEWKINQVTNNIDKIEKKL